MIIISLILANTGILLFISFLHYYWAAGGAWRRNTAIPITQEENKVFKPGKFATSVVATGLFVFAFLTLSSTGLFNPIISPYLSFYGNLAIGIIFFLRAIGDGKYVGVLKKIKTTSFARNDTKLYTPICLIIAVIAFSISFKLHQSV
jgi:hypothetical protein